MNTVLVTGGLGFIGHHIVRHYLDNKWEVIIVDNLTKQHDNTKLIKYRIEHVSSDKCTFLDQDCRYPQILKSKLPKNSIDHIVHLAGSPNQAAVLDNILDGASNIHTATTAMSLLANHLDTKIIYVSSSMVYGHFNTVGAQIEDASLNPVNLYGLFKKQGEELVKMIAKKYTIVRPSAVYGPGDNSKRVIGKWILCALENRPIQVTNPSALLDFTYVDDLVKGIVALGHNKFNEETYNITYGQARSLGEVALLIKHITKSKSEIFYYSEETNEPVRGSMDISKARNDFNYKPQYDIIKGITEYTRWMQTYYGY